MELTIIDWVLILFYFLLIIFIGIWAKRKQTTGEFLIADRKIGVFQTAASIVAVLGGMVLVSQAALAYELGFSTIWFWIGFSLGTLFLGLAAKKIKVVADKFKFLTIGDYIFTKFDYKTGILATIILFFSFFALLVGQFIAGASLFAPLLNIPYSSAVLILGIVTLFYLILGGFKAVIKTDFLQFLIMFFIFIFLVFTINFGEYSPEQLNFGAIGVFSILIFLVMGTFVMFGAADIWQRIFASKSVKTAKNASYLAAAMFLVLGTILTFVGVAAKNNFPNVDSSQALYYGLFNLVPTPLLVLSVLVILAAIMSTIDTELFVLSSSIAKDFCHRRKEKSEEQMAKIIKNSLIVLAAISMIIAIFFSEIITLLFAIVSLLLAISPVIIASLFWRIRNNAAFLSILGGFLAFLSLIFIGNLNADTAVITLPAAILFLIIGQIVFKKN
ncbi:sodium:solute symporter family protein [Candidatus Pacearchaeota archaeon]|nr:sodium:solute symporter family protein [Candidatus Pacearchaeota archaeon]